MKSPLQMLRDYRQQASEQRQVFEMMKGLSEEQRGSLLMLNAQRHREDFKAVVKRHERVGILAATGSLGSFLGGLGAVNAALYTGATAGTVFLAPAAVAGVLGLGAVSGLAMLAKKLAGNKEKSAYWASTSAQDGSMANVLQARRRFGDLKITREDVTQMLHQQRQAQIEPQVQAVLNDLSSHDDIDQLIGSVSAISLVRSQGGALRPSQAARMFQALTKAGDFDTLNQLNNVLRDNPAMARVVEVTDSILKVHEAHSPLQAKNVQFSTFVKPQAESSRAEAPLASQAGFSPA